MIAWLGGWFSPEQYLHWTRIQCCAWTAADFVIVFSLIRLADLARRLCGAPGHRGAYAALLTTLPFALCVPFARTGGQIFVLELLITVPHFALILYVAIHDLPVFPRALSLILIPPTMTPRKDRTGDAP